ncbi:MAG TPA: thioredoxin domain-containing protein [Desulfurivibrionaceae bacterium]|nr:thioredoxin domain-containing protein [Desulfurivibrionaceae bacterium]
MQRWEVKVMRIDKIDTRGLPADGGDRYNRLVFEKSPYLLQHAENPIAWYPWGEAALSRARAENKPIFLSIGYATCHWCHVMARESFEDPEVAALLNRDFIAVKVDREERPDLDAVYMKICQEVTGSGGWPLTVLLTPERKPFLVGTYFPKEARAGRPGLLEILASTGELWKHQRAKLVDSANRVVELLGGRGNGAEADLPDRQFFAQAAQQLTGSFDAEYGGFGRPPKFPVPHQYLFLLRHWQRSGDPHCLEMVNQTLTALRQGGIYDQLGFGFHRYSTDREWLVPHFEKMLYDQALLALAYLEFYQAGGQALPAETAREIFAYVNRDLSAPEGGFYSAEDADSEGEEGLFYLWSEAEIREILGEERGSRFTAKYRVQAGGNFREETGGESRGLNILHLAQDDVELSELAEERRQLLAVRDKRVRPLLDDKVLTAWNGLMIAALARGGRVLNDPGLTGRAERAAEFLLTHMKDDQGRLLRSYRQGEARIPAFLDDHAFLAWCLLELFLTTFAPRYLAEAAALTRTMLELFGDEPGGALTFSGRGNEELVMTSREFYDGALPSGNSVALYNLARLAWLLEDAALAGRARELAAACGAAAAEYPAGHTMFLTAYDLLSQPTGELVVVGRRDEPETRQVMALLNRTYLPAYLLLFREEGAEGDRLAELVPLLRNKKMLEGLVTLYPCRERSCREPLHGLAAIAAALPEFIALGTAKR